MAELLVRDRDLGRELLNLRPTSSRATKHIHRTAIHCAVVATTDPDHGLAPEDVYGGRREVIRRPV